MMNNIILNGVNSNTIQGLIIQELPPISKPAIRTEIEEIDGRDGDVITKLGYAAYDKQLSIGLYGNYDINQVISFFNTSGTVIFSNEPDKYYNYQILNEIDFERLVRFRTAIVTMHVQPFKYSATETPQELSGTVITGEGTNISLVNTTDSGLFTDLQKKGDTFQQTYTGKNLFNGTYKKYAYSAGLPYSETTDSNITINSSDSNNINFTLNANSYIYVLTDIIQLNPNTQYTISFTRTDTGGGGSTSNRNRNYIYSVDNNTYASLANTPINSTGNVTITFTTTASGKVTFAWGSNNGSSGQVINIKNIMIEQGSTATSYEPYVGGTPSPNPDYPQEVQTVTGNNNVTICGKNLFDKDNANILNGFISDGGTLVSDNVWKTLYIQCKPNTTYTVQKISGKAFRVADYENVPTIGATYISRIKNDTATSITFATSSTGNYLAVSYIRETDTLTNQQILDSIQIEYGSTATEYEAYTSQTYPINLGNIELCEIEGAYDYIYKNNGTWYKHSVIGKQTFNGSENWSGGTFQSSHRYKITVNNATTPSSNDFNLYSNYFTPSVKVLNTQITTGEMAHYNGTKDFYFSSSETSTNNFKTWLSTHNTVLYYLLATPTDTEITDSTLLSQLNALGNATTYLGVTNIIVSGSVLTPILYVQTVAVDDPVLKITNSGNTTAKPIMTLYGTGTINLSLNGEQIFVIDLSSENYITIDVANMEAYYNGILKNRLVTGNYENFVLNQGENEITFTGTLYSLTISNYSRWI